MATYQEARSYIISGIIEKGLFYSVIFFAIAIAVWPIFYLLLKTFSAGFISIPPLTVENWQGLFTEEVLFILFNTFLFAFPAAFGEVILGTFLAWIIEQTDTPGERYLRQFVILPYLIPTAVAPLAWILLLDPEVGFINSVAKLFGLPVFDVYGYWGMLFATILQGAPLAYLLTSSSIRNMGAPYIEAAIISEAGPIRIFWDQVVKMNRPAVLSAGVLTLSKNLGFVGIPLLLGVPDGFYILSTAMVNVTSGGAVPNYGMASVFGMVIIVISFAIVFIYLRSVGGEERFTSQGGRNINNLQTGRWKWAFLVFAVGFIFVGGILPISILVIQSFTVELSILGNLTWSLVHWGETLALPEVQHGTINAILLGFGVGIAATLLAFVISWITHQTDIPYTKNFDERFWIALSVPSLAVSLVMLLLLARTPLYGTPLVFILPLMYTPLHIAIRYTSPAISQIDRELFEAGHISGDTNLGIMTRIGMPLTRGVLLASIANTFVQIIRNLSSIFFLVLPGATLIAYTVFQFTATAQYNKGSVLSLVLISMGTIGWYALNIIRERFDVSDEH